MGRIAVYEWRDKLTREERAEIRTLDLTLSGLSDKIKAVKQKRAAIQNRASKRAARDEVEGNSDN